MSSHDMTLVDEIRRRLDATYEEACEGLKEAGGDLPEALAAVERRRGRKSPGDGELLRRVLALAPEGGLKGVRVRLGERVVSKIPLKPGALGALLISLVSVLVSELVVEPVRDQGPGSGDQGMAGETRAEAEGTAA